MNITFFNYRYLLTLLFFSHIPAYSTTIVQGNASSPFTFTTTVTAQAYDPVLGTLYVGLEGGATTYALSKVIRPLGTSTPTFSGIATNALLTNETIELLTLATSYGNTAPNLALVKKDTYFQEQKKVIVATTDGSTVKESTNDLNDASGALNIDGEYTAGIIALAAQDSFIFAAVRPHDGNFGELYSGIALVNINAQTLEPIQIAAVTGDAGIKAKQTDATSNEIRITNDPTLRENTATLYWDDILERLYLGLQLTTTTAPHSGAKSVVVAYINNCKLDLLNIAPNIAFTNTATNMVGIDNVTEQSLAVAHIRTMHCSTGPDYLIINGGNGTIDQTNNLIFALPLVNDPTTPTAHGTLAKKDAALTNYKFTVPASLNADLPTSAEPAVTVGTSSLPIQADTPISDIAVIGDTVYVSINTALSALNDTGIFYTQALFDENGKIVRWTPWKRVFPCDSCLNLPNSQGRTTFFAVDAVTGKIWAVDGSSNKTVRITSWDRGGTNTTGLATILTTELYDGSYTALDLDQSTRDFVNSTTHRYALFGGVDKITFARTGQALGNQINSPQEIITDFSSTTNVSTTKLPNDGGCIRCLEYARRLTGDGNQNYFFAGTENGLFVFADASGNGFNVNSLNYLNAAPFSGGSWQKIDTIHGTVNAIKTSGRALYVLTSETSSTTPVKSTLYRIPFTSNITTMFASSNIYTLAATQTGTFSNVILFPAIQIISTATDGSKEQLVLATNKGLYRSAADEVGGNGIIDAINQTTANWQLITLNDVTLYSGIAGIDNAIIPTTIWPLSIQDESGLQTYERSSIHQLTGSTIATSFNFLPSFFNAIDASTAFLTLDPLRYFWSDGARRLFIINRPYDVSTKNKLMSFPYNVQIWNIAYPEQTIIYDPIIAAISRFYWIKQIGTTGILLVGTDNGVAALE